MSWDLQWKNLYLRSWKYYTQWVITVCPEGADWSIIVQRWSCFPNSVSLVIYSNTPHSESVDGDYIAIFWQYHQVILSLFNWTVMLLSLGHFNVVLPFPVTLRRMCSYVSSYLMKGHRQCVHASAYITLRFMKGLNAQLSKALCIYIILFCTSVKMFNSQRFRGIQWRKQAGRIITFSNK